jgi:hypothetical protein
MIFTKDYADQESSKALLSDGGNRWRIYVYGIICVLVAFVFALLLSSLESTVVSEALPTFSGANARSSFAVMTFLTPIMIIFTISYLFANYFTMTFAELHTNRIYMLIKNGVKMKQIILLRLYSAIAMPIFLYAVSFIISLFTCMIFNFSLNITAIPGLFLGGLILIILTSLSILVVSLFVYNIKYALTIFLFGVVAMIVFAILSNYTNVIQASINVANLSVIFGAKTTYFLFICIGLIAICGLVCILKSNQLIKYYSTNRADVQGIMVMDYNTNVAKKVKKDNSLRKEKVFNGVVYGVFGLFLTISFLTNLFLIYMGTNNLTTQTLYNNYIPVIFGSETMTQGDSEIDSTLEYPQFIEKNDLAVFESAVDTNVNIGVGNIVYYINSDTSEAVIVKVKSINDAGYQVDITYYPNSDLEGTLATTLTRNQIKGVCVYVNREVGAWVTLNDSTIGKIVFLVLPLIIIIFYDKIKRLGLAYKQIEESNEIQRKK